MMLLSILFDHQELPTFLTPFGRCLYCDDPMTSTQSLCVCQLFGNLGAGTAAATTMDATTIRHPI